MRPGVLGHSNEARFDREFAKPIEMGMASNASAKVYFDSLNKAGELNGLLEPYVHRVDAAELRKDIPPMQQVVLHVRQTRTQGKLYRAYKRMQNTDAGDVKNNFLKMYASLRPIHNHPGSLFYPSDLPKKMKSSDDREEIGDWWRPTVEKEGEDQVKRVMNGYKVALLFHILAYAETIGDKVVIFANSLATLNYIEYALALDWSEHVPSLAARFPGMKLGGWTKSKDYFRIDGTVTGAERGDLVNQFEKDDCAKAFLLSKAGGIGINLVSMYGRSMRRSFTYHFSYTLRRAYGCADKRQSYCHCRPTFQPNYIFASYFSIVSLRADQAGVLLHVAYSGNNGRESVWSMCEQDRHCASCYRQKDY